jgi:hypothetical protein
MTLIADYDDGTNTRVRVTVDADGDRTAVTYDPTRTAEPRDSANCLTRRRSADDNSELANVLRCSTPYSTIEVQTWHAMQEMTLLFPWKEIKPLSINYTKPSIQASDFVDSGATVLDDKRLFRVTLKDMQLVELDNDEYVRKHPKLIGPITSGADFEDFRTFTGRILRVPGQLKDPGGNPSNFTDYGW